MKNMNGPDIQGELSGESEKPGKKNKGQGLTAMGADKKDY